MTDLVLLVIEYCHNDKDKLHYLMTCKDHYSLIDHITFNSPYLYKKILPVLDKYNFKSIMVRSVSEFRIFVNNKNMAQKNIEQLVFSDKFNDNINRFIMLLENIPSIKHLKFGNRFNKEIDRIPNTIKHLTFGNSFNRTIPNNFGSITHLTFGSSYDKDYGTYPTSITHLKFGKRFNPFGDELNYILKNLINLECLEFGEKFERVFDNIPTTLKTLTLSEKYCYIRYGNGINFIKKFDGGPTKIIIKYENKRLKYLYYYVIVNGVGNNNL
jgi:hypothetical protein